jgi:hypothetical protein
LDLKKVERVKYVLDPTFTPSVVELGPNSRQEKFRYEAMGYDSFWMEIWIYVTTISTPHVTKYFLDIRKESGEQVETVPI